MHQKKVLYATKYMVYAVGLLVLFLLQTTPSFLQVLGVKPQLIVPAVVVIAMYEGEINMVIHAKGGQITVEITPEQIRMILADVGPGIPDVELAMQAGYSTAPDEVRSLGFGAGMGLPNMKKYTDEMSIDTRIGEGTTITMAVRL